MLDDNDTLLKTLFLNAKCKSSHRYEPQNAFSNIFHAVSPRFLEETAWKIIYHLAQACSIRTGPGATQLWRGGIFDVAWLRIKFWSLTSSDIRPSESCRFAVLVNVRSPSCEPQRFRIVVEFQLRELQDSNKVGRSSAIPKSTQTIAKIPIWVTSSTASVEPTW